MAGDGPRFREYPIHPRLAAFVNCIWACESDHAIYDAPSERILPDSCVELVFHFHDPFRCEFAAGESAFLPRSFVVGQMKRYLEIQPAGRIGLVAVRFHARGAYRFLPHPLTAIANDAVDLRELWRHDATEWIERVALAASTYERIALIERLLLQCLRRNFLEDRAVDRCLELIDTSDGQLNAKQLAASIGLSNRQLSRRFGNAVGVTPKEFSRVKRFLAAVRLLRAGRRDQLADLALECGYFDQAHFNHDFHEFAGITPREFLTRTDVVF